MAEIKCKYEVCTCAVPHELCPHPLGRASEEETKALAERLCGPFDGHSDGFSMEVAREALRWRDETRPVQAPPAADYAGDAGPATDDDFVDLPAAVPAPEVLVRAYFHRFSEVEDDYTIYHTLDGVCEQCIPVLIVRDAAALAANKENDT